jgi:hypothetical protein
MAGKAESTDFKLNVVRPVLIRNGTIRSAKPMVHAAPTEHCIFDAIFYEHGAPAGAFLAARGAAL